MNKSCNNYEIRQSPLASPEGEADGGQDSMKSLNILDLLAFNTRCASCAWDLIIWKHSKVEVQLFFQPHDENQII